MVILRSRRYLSTAHFTDMLPLCLQDVKAFIDVYGCDIDQGIFTDCIFALDNKVREAKK